MDNTYTYAGTTATNSVTMDDVTSSPGVANPNFVENTWRIRGAYAPTGTAPNVGSPTNSKNVNGWNLSAPQYTQGAEFDVSTAGFSNLKFNFSGTAVVPEPSIYTLLASAFLLFVGCKLRRDNKLRRA